MAPIEVGKSTLELMHMQLKQKTLSSCTVQLTEVADPDFDLLLLLKVLHDRVVVVGSGCLAASASAF